MSTQPPAALPDDGGELDKKLEIILDEFWSDCHEDYEFNILEKRNGLDIAKHNTKIVLKALIAAERQAGEREGRIDELKNLEELMGIRSNSYKQTALNMAKKDSGVEGLAHGMKMAGFGWFQAHREVKDRLKELTYAALAGKGEDNVSL